jgi:hypothetical protein
MRRWLVVDADKHRVAKAPGASGLWAGYCPARGVDDLIYAHGFPMMFALFATPCPHLDENYDPIGGDDE